MAVSDFWCSGFLGVRAARIFGNCGFLDFLVPGFWWFLVFYLLGFLASRDNLRFRCLAFKIRGLLDARSTRRAELAKVSVASLELLSNLVYSAGSGKSFGGGRLPATRDRWAAREKYKSTTQDLLLKIWNDLLLKIFYKPKCGRGSTRRGPQGGLRLFAWFV